MEWMIRGIDYIETNLTAEIELKEAAHMLSRILDQKSSPLPSNLKPPYTKKKQRACPI